MAHLAFIPTSRKQLRLATLVTTGVCIIVLMTTAVQLMLVDYFAIRYARKEAELRLQQLSWQMRDSLNHVVEKAAGDVRLVASLAQVRDARDPAAARRVLDSLQEQFPEYAWIGVADMRGKVFAAAGGLLENADVSTRPWFKDSQSELRASDYHPARLLGKLLPQSAEPWRFIDIAMPVQRSDGSRWGVLGVHMSWSWARKLARDLLTPALREYGAEIFVVRKDGTVLLGPGGMEEQILQTDSLKLALNGQTGSVRETWPDKVDYLTGFCQTGKHGDPTTLQWSILVRQPEEAALAASHQLEQSLFWLSMAVGGLLAIFSAFLARKLTRPMNDLSRVIEQRAGASIHGQEVPPIPVIGGFREVQVLSEAMREMVRSEDRHVLLLKAMNEHLEVTVAERTAELENLVMSDMLTGLPNRRSLMQKLSEAMLRCERSKQPCAVMFMDLDGFKSINDTYGHEEGDELLRQFGHRIVAAVRNTDSVARLAGDEFVVLLECLNGPSDPEALGRKILPLLRAPYVLKSATVSVGASIGIALHAPGSCEDRDALLARADAAMYDAKRRGKNTVVMAAVTF